MQNHWTPTDELSSYAGRTDRKKKSYTSLLTAGPLLIEREWALIETLSNGRTNFALLPAQTTTLAARCGYILETPASLTHVGWEDPILVHLTQPSETTNARRGTDLANQTSPT